MQRDPEGSRGIQRDAEGCRGRGSDDVDRRRQKHAATFDREGNDMNLQSYKVGSALTSTDLYTILSTRKTVVERDAYNIHLLIEGPHLSPSPRVFMRVWGNSSVKFYFTKCGDTMLRRNSEKLTTVEKVSKILQALLSGECSRDDFEFLTGVRSVGVKNAPSIVIRMSSDDI
jgi:hypothetical protein